MEHDVQEPAAPVAPEKPPVDPKVGDLVEMTFGRGQVRLVREDGMLQVEAIGWEMANEQRARYVFRKEDVKVVPTVYYQMSGNVKGPIRDHTLDNTLHYQKVCCAQSV